MERVVSKKEYEMKQVEIRYEDGLSFADVVEKLPRITKEMEVYHDNSILSFKLMLEDKNIGEVFYDEKTNHYCYDPRFNMELHQTVGDTIREYYYVNRENIEHLIEKIDENIAENTYIDFSKLFREKEYIFNFGEENFPDGRDKYVKVLASTHQEAIKIMEQSHYQKNYYRSYAKENYIKEHEIEREHCIDIFTQNTKDYIFTKDNEYGYTEKIALQRDEVYDFAYKIFVEEGDEDFEISEINRVNLEEGGVDEALNMLSEYSDYHIEKSDSKWREVVVPQTFDMDILNNKESSTLSRDEKLFVLNACHYKVLTYGLDYKVEGNDDTFKSIEALYHHLDNKAKIWLKEDTDYEDNTELKRI